MCIRVARAVGMDLELKLPGSRQPNALVVAPQLPALRSALPQLAVLQVAGGGANSRR
jgi:hypothetical protein